MGSCGFKRKMEFWGIWERLKRKVIRRASELATSWLVSKGGGPNSNRGVAAIPMSNSPSRGPEGDKTATNGQKPIRQTCRELQLTSMGLCRPPSKPWSPSQQTSNVSTNPHLWTQRHNTMAGMQNTNSWARAETRRALLRRHHVGVVLFGSLPDRNRRHTPASPLSKY
mgnify:CR=1 FL=1|jgi:hypothetical protein